MAGWSILTNGSALDCADIIKSYQDGDCCVEVNHAANDCNLVDDSTDDCEVKLRWLFDQVLLAFLNKAAARECVRPLPALLGDEQSLDLFKLFWVVRKRGGFDLVNGFWTFVAKELGFDPRVSASIKLIYFKYLYELERCLRRSHRDGRLLGNGESQCGGNFGFLPLELETQFRSLISHGYGQMEKIHTLASMEYKKNDKHLEVGKRKIGLLDTKDAQRMCNGVGNMKSDDDKKFHDNNPKCFHDDDNGLMISDLSIGKKNFNLRKRKRESLSKMLNWVIQIAKCPDDPSLGKMPPLSKWKDHKGEELWIQAIRARNSLLRRRWDDANTEQSLFQSNQKIHPSMYEDVSLLSVQTAERIRCSERLPALAKRGLCCCCSSCSAPQSETSPIKKEFKNCLKEPELVVDDLPATNTTPCPSEDEHFQRHVSVGPRFQAEVPEWTGMVFGSDSKWLGTQVWPLEYEIRNVTVVMDPIGKGRPGLCGCQLPGSVGCIRFHIAENRIKLKLELGVVFYHWRFDHMGEEISLRWTTEEEKRFKDMVRFNAPSLGKCFWDDACKYFPRKTREELVSYYFNVFQFRRRSYQNRVTPKNTDSDDDESEFGSCSDSYGHEAVNVPGANILICSENKQYTDFE